MIERFKDLKIVRGLFLILVGLFLTQTLSFSQEKINCNVKVIYATKKAPYINEKLKSLWSYLKKSFGARWTSFDIIDEKILTLERDKNVEISLPENEKLGLKYSGITEEKGLIRLHLDLSGYFKTKIRIHNKGVFFQAGKKYKDGILIFSISPEVFEESK